MRSFEQAKDQLAARGVRIIAISVDPPGVTEKLRRTHKYTYTFLSDPKTEVIRRYYVLHPGGGVNGPDVARPAQFLVDSKGVIRWLNVIESYNLLDIPGIVNKALDSLTSSQSFLTPLPRSGLRALAHGSHLSGKRVTWRSGSYG